MPKKYTGPIKVKPAKGKKYGGIHAPTSSAFQKVLRGKKSSKKDWKGGF